MAITAQELETLLVRIDLQNAAYKLNDLSSRARKSKNFADIAKTLASEITEKFFLLQKEIDGMIDDEIAAEKAQIAAEQAE